MARETANLTKTAREDDENWLHERPEEADNFPANPSQSMLEAIDGLRKHRRGNP